MSFHGLPCWYELGAKDADAAQGFYSAVLGWSWRDAGMPGMDYRLALAGEAMVAGMMPVMGPEQPVAWTLYFAVEGCDATAAQAQGLGAQVIVPPSDIPGTGRFALLIDPQGAAFGILQPLPGGTGGAFDQQKAGHGNWHELNSPDADAAQAFYGALFGWTVPRVHDMGPDMAYRILSRDGLDFGGIAPQPGQPACWTPYFGTASVAGAVAALTAAGGSALHPPMPVPGGAVIVNAADPQGARFAVVGPA
jgi:predicted enzyme related to lactoylglutathione lyase